MSSTSTPNQNARPKATAFKKREVKETTKQHDPFAKFDNKNEDGPSTKDQCQSLIKVQASQPPSPSNRRNIKSRSHNRNGNTDKNLSAESVSSTTTNGTNHLGASVSSRRLSDFTYSSAVTNKISNRAATTDESSNNNNKNNNNSNSFDSQTKKSDNLQLSNNLDQSTYEFEVSPRGDGCCVII